MYKQEYFISLVFSAFAGPRFISLTSPSQASASPYQERDAFFNDHDGLVQKALPNSHILNMLTIETGNHTNVYFFPLGCVTVNYHDIKKDQLWDSTSNQMMSLDMNCFVANTVGTDENSRKLQPSEERGANSLLSYEYDGEEAIDMNMVLALLQMSPEKLFERLQEARSDGDLGQIKKEERNTNSNFTRTFKLFENPFSSGSNGKLLASVANRPQLQLKRVSSMFTIMGISAISVGALGIIMSRIGKRSQSTCNLMERLYSQLRDLAKTPPKWITTLIAFGMSKLSIKSKNVERVPILPAAEQTLSDKRKRFLPARDLCIEHRRKEVGTYENTSHKQDTISTGTHGRSLSLYMPNTSRRYKYFETNRK